MDGIKSSGVKGSWFVFYLKDNYGNFEKATIKQRIKGNEIDKFLCLHNTNLQNVYHSKGKGFLLMKYDNRIRSWRLCFVFKLSKHGAILYEWKGKMNECGFPMFLYRTLREYIEMFETNFVKIIYPGLPDKCYFINIIFNNDINPPSFMHERRSFPVVNNIDGCIDQSRDGPCQLFIPTLLEEKSLQTMQTTLNSRKRLYVQYFDDFDESNESHWTQIPTAGVCHEEKPFDVIFVPIFKYKSPPHKSMLIVAPEIHKKTFQQKLPKNWAIQNVAEYEFGEKLPNTMKTESFFQDVSSFATCVEQRLVHDGPNMRLFLINSEKEWKQLLNNKIENDQMHLKYGRGYEAILLTSCKDPIHLPGIYVSGWCGFADKDKASIIKTVDYDFCRSVHEVFNIGHGPRLISKCDGVNLYLGERSNSRACMNPAVGPKQTQKQQYHRQSWSRDGDEAFRAYLETQVRKLPIKTSMSILAHAYSSFIGFKTCDKVIWTSGKPGGVFSFSNESHRDAKDFVDKTNKDDYLAELKEYSLNLNADISIIKHIRNIIDFKQEIPMPTTCVYLHCWRDKVTGNEDKRKGIVFQYFDYSCIGVSKRIGNEHTHWMLPGLIDHRTTKCIVVSEGIIYTINHEDIEEFSLIAWGSSGGSAESRKNAAKRRKS